MTEELPQELGRYRIIRRLGTGGMAEVFLAKSTGAEGIEKVLVLKRVLPSFARSAKFISMFIDEAKVAMRLNHPNIVQVYAFEQVKTEFLLAMELVDGLDLGRLVAAVRRSGRKLPPGLAAYVVQEVSKGLDYAHKRKDASGQPMDIVHRDVSPQNVLMSYEGVVKVADFGIAKARMVSEETGVIKGKFAYMSPEQARGDHVDHRSDVYSLGILLAELLMGRPMYPGLQGLDVLAKVRDAELTLPSDVDPEVPKALDRIVRRATSADREHRYQTARSLAGALTQYLHGLDKVWDAPPLEDFIREVSPRSQTNPELSPTPLAEGATLLSGVSRGERRERRRVVVVSGLLRRGDTSTNSEAAVGAQAAKVLEAIAYKADAVLSWPDGEGRSRFRFIVGLGKTSVNDPLKAVRIAIDTIEALQGLSADMLSPIGASLGLSRGMVSTIRDVSGRLIRYAPVGTILEVAERLAQAADVNHVLSAGEVYRLVRRDFTFEEEEREIDVQTLAGGASQAIRAWRLRGVRSSERVEPETPELVGREAELDAISAVFREAVSGPQTMFVHIRGEIGAGKSALAGAAVAALEPSRTLFAQCSFGSVDAPFSAVADLIRSAAGVPEDANPSAATEKLRLLVEDCVPPARHQLVYDGVAPILGAASSIQEDGDHFRLVTRAVEVLIAGLAQAGPLIVWVDNLQWADAPSLDVLHAIRQRNHKAPCLVLLVGRAEADLPSALRDIPQVTVGELEGKARAELVQQRFDAVVPTEILQAIEARAGGNPFFLREVVEALLERGAVEVRGEGAGRQAYRRPGVPIQLPTTLEGVVAARLDELTNEESHALRWLAVAGAGLQTDEISRLAGTNMRDPIESLSATRLIHRRASGGLDFPSGVVRQVAYEATDIEDRIRMHRRIAQLLQEKDEAPGRIARHLEQAGERAAAAQAYLDAADNARTVYSNREALRFFGRALQLLAPDDNDSRFRAHEGREQIYRFLGRTQDQRMELEAMRTIARRSGGPRRRALALLRLTRFELDAAEIESADELMREAREASKASGDLALELDALRLEAEMARGRGESQRALAACDEAIERAGTSKELLSSRGQILIQRGIVLRRIGQLEDAFEAYAEAIVIFRRLHIRRAEAYALNSLGVALAGAGVFEEAIKVFRASIHIDRQTGDRLRLGRKLSNIGQLYDTLGDTKQGLAFVQRALDVFEGVDDRAGRCDALSAIAEMMLESGRAPQDAAVPLDQARRIANRLGSHYEIARERIVRAQLEERAGNRDAAREAAEHGLKSALAEDLAFYELHARARLASLEEDPAKVKEHADVVLTRLGEGVSVEHVDRLYVLLAKGLRGVGDEPRAAECDSASRAAIERQAAQIGTDAIRDRFLASKGLA